MKSGVAGIGTLWVSATDDSTVLEEASEVKVVVPQVSFNSSEVTVDGLFSVIETLSLVSVSEVAAVGLVRSDVVFLDLQAELTVKELSSNNKK